MRERHACHPVNGFLYCKHPGVHARLHLDMLGMKSHCLGVLVQVYVAAFCVAAVSGDDSHLVVKELLHCKFTWIDKTNGVQTECAAAADGRYAVLYSEAASKGSSIYTPSSGSWWTPEEFVSVIPGSYQLMAAPLRRFRQILGRLLRRVSLAAPACMDFAASGSVGLRIWNRADFRLLNLLKRDARSVSRLGRCW